MSSAALPAHPIAGVSYRTGSEVLAHYRSGAWLRMTIGDAARRAGTLHRDRPFLIAEGSSTSFGDFDVLTERLAVALLNEGLAPGDRAIFQMGTTPDTAIALVGCFKAGVVPVCTLPQHREIEIGQLGELAAPRAYFVQADFHPTFDLVGFARKMAESLPSRPMLIVAGGSAASGLSLAGLMEPAAGAAARVDGVTLHPSDVAIFQLSGGSTGVPKIIPRMHGEYLAQARDWNERQHLAASDVSLWCLPLIHNAGIITSFLPCLLAGRPLVLQSAFREESFLEAVARHKVTYTGSIGPIAGRLLESPYLARYDLRSLRQIWAFNRADDLEARLGATAQNIYGITEGILMCSSPNASPERRHGTIGNPVGRCDEILLRAIDGTEPVPDGELGELCFKGASVLSSYYGGTARDPAQFTGDGFFRTGDVLRATWIDGERCFVFEGRLKDNISRGGEKYGAEEVETLLVRHPSVLDARVVAMPDRLYGEKGCAFLILREGCASPSLAELGELLLGLGLAKYKLPERIEVLEQFPLTRVGKVDKVQLRERIAAVVRSEQAT